MPKLALGDVLPYPICASETENYNERKKTLHEKIDSKDPCTYKISFQLKK